MRDTDAGAYSVYPKRTRIDYSRIFILIKLSAMNNVLVFLTFVLKITHAQLNSVSIHIIASVEITHPTQFSENSYYCQCFAVNIHITASEMQTRNIRAYHKANTRLLSNKPVTNQ